jgi:hypothetical protein
MIMRSRFVLVVACVTVCGAAQGAAPAPSIHVRSERRGPLVVSAIDNHTGASIDLRNGLTVERWANGEWSAISDRELPITLAGYPGEPACVSVAAGATLTADDGWLGTTCFGLAPCHANTPVESGTYRVVARTCRGDRVVAGAPFTWHRSA